MAQTYKATYNWTTELDVTKGTTIQTQYIAIMTKRPTNSDIEAEATTIMNTATQAHFAKEMAKRGVTDYKFRSIQTKATVQLVPKGKTAVFATGGTDKNIYYDPGLHLGVKVLVTVTGSTTIEFDDILGVDDIVIILFAIATFVAANPWIIAGLLIIGGIIVIGITGTQVLDAGGRLLSAAGEAVNKATSTTGGTLLSIVIFMVGIVILTGGIYLVYRWWKGRRSSSKY